MQQNTNVFALIIIHYRSTTFKFFKLKQCIFLEFSKLGQALKYACLVIV